MLNEYGKVCQRCGAQRKDDKCFARLYYEPIYALAYHVSDWDKIKHRRVCWACWHNLEIEKRGRGKTNE